MDSDSERLQRKDVFERAHLERERAGALMAHAQTLIQRARVAVEHSQAFRLSQAKAGRGEEDDADSTIDAAAAEVEAGERLAAMEEVVNQMSNQVGAMLAEAAAMRRRIADLEAQLGPSEPARPRRRRGAEHLRPLE